MANQWTGLPKSMRICPLESWVTVTVSSPSSSTRSASCLTVIFTLLLLAEITTLEASRQRLAARGAGRLRHRSTVAFVLRVNSFLNPLFRHRRLREKGGPPSSEAQLTGFTRRSTSIIREPHWIEEVHCHPPQNHHRRHHHQRLPRPRILDILERTVDQADRRQHGDEIPQQSSSSQPHSVSCPGPIENASAAHDRTRAARVDAWRR